MRRRYAQGGGQRPIPRHRAHWCTEQTTAGPVLFLAVSDCDWRLRLYRVPLDRAETLPVACPECGEMLDRPDLPPWVTDALSAA